MISLTCNITRDLSSSILSDVPVLDADVLTSVRVGCDVTDGIATWQRWDLEVLVDLDGAILLQARRAL